MKAVLSVAIDNGPRFLESKRKKIIENERKSQMTLPLLRLLSVLLLAAPLWASCATAATADLSASSSPVAPSAAELCSIRP